MKKLYIIIVLAAVLLVTGCMPKKNVKTVKIITGTTDGESITIKTIDEKTIDGNSVFLSIGDDGDTLQTIVMSSLIGIENSGKTYIKITEDGEIVYDDSLSIDKILEDELPGIEIGKAYEKRIVVINEIGDDYLSIPGVKIIKVTIDEETSQVELEINGEKYILPEDIDKLKELEESRQKPEVKEAEDGPPSD